MKIRYMLLALLPLCMASCSEDENMASGEMQQPVRVTAGAGPQSRITLSDEGEYYNTLWQNGDKITLFTSTQSNLLYSTSISENATTAEFAPEGETLESIDGSTVYACYPDVLQASEQNLVVNLPSTQELDYDNGNKLSSFAYGVGTISNGAVNFRFHHISAFLSVTVIPEMLTDATKGIRTVTLTTSSDVPLSVGEGDTFDFSTYTAAVTNGSNTVRVNVDNHVVDSDWTVYIPFLPQPAGTQITLTMADSEGETLYTVTKDAPEAGFLAEYVYRIDSEVPYDGALLVDGITFNARIKQLVNGNVESGVAFTEDSVDSLITKINFETEVFTLPEEYITVSADNSSTPVYASFNSADSLLTVFTSAKNIEIEDASFLFNRLTSLRSINFGNFKVNEVTTKMLCMFQDCYSLTALDVSDWDTSNVTDMANLFYYCSSLSSLDVSGWDTSNVTTMAQMFCRCSSLASLNVSGWDTANVTEMNFMFNYCSSLPSLDVSGWNTSNVTTMTQMFNGCSSLTALNLSGWDTAYVTEMNFMFNMCSLLETLDISNWDTSNVTNMDGMFGECSSLASLDVSKWKTSKVTSMLGMFNTCSSLTALDLSRWNTVNVTNISCMFTGCLSLTTLDLSYWNISKVTDMDILFYGCPMLADLNIAYWSFDDDMLIELMFGECASVSQACKITSLPEAKEFLLGKTETTYMVPEYFMWDTAATKDNNSSYEDMPKVEW